MSSRPEGRPVVPPRGVEEPVSAHFGAARLPRRRLVAPFRAGEAGARTDAPRCGSGDPADVQVALHVRAVAVDPCLTLLDRPREAEGPADAESGCRQGRRGAPVDGESRLSCPTAAARVEGRAGTTAGGLADAAKAEGSPRGRAAPVRATGRSPSWSSVQRWRSSDPKAPGR